jgi:diguanylate cyclase (GGDEF)-like protein
MMKIRLAGASNATKLGIFSFLLFSVLLTGYLYETYQEGIAGAEKESQNYAWTLSEQARSVFEAADDELLNLEEFLKQSDFQPQGKADSVRASKIHQVFDNYATERKFLDALNAFDANGNLLYSSIAPLPAIHVADRPYFRQIKAHPELERVFSDPLISRTTGKPTIIMSRRFLDSDGRFIGTIQAYVGLDQFVRVYRSLNIGRHGVISMRTANGFLRMAEYPVVSEQQQPITASMDHPLRPYFERKQIQGTLDLVSPSDRIRRTVSFHQIGDYPFYVDVGCAVRDYEARWRLRAAVFTLALMIYGAIVFLFVRDVTESKMIEQESRHKAHHDHLTGLPNRALFLDHSEHAILRAKRNQQKLAILFLDLDGFKQVNDTLGHDVGDLLLTEVAKRLKVITRSSDTVARMGGDEFTFVLNDISDDENASSVAQKIIAELEQPFELQGHRCRISGSIGIAIYPTDSLDYETLLKQADEAMYLAKKNGKNSYRFHHIAAISA